MKKIILCLIMMFSLFGCAKGKPYQEIPITMDELKEKIENKETFNVMIIRDNCEFCDALHKYIDETKQEHYDIVLYTIDSTNFDFKKDEETGLLKSNTEEGQYLLSFAPYFLYTPTIYCFEEGEVITTGIGFNDAYKTISIWDNNSTIDFSKAQTIDFWDFIY